MRLFYVLYPDEAELSFSLNAIRLLANPYAKDRAHLTVRGPCSRHYQARTLARLNEQIRGAHVQVADAAAFFAGKQNTVYLACVSDALRTVWHKPDYDYHPHITLYDGESRPLAEALLSLLAAAPLTLGFAAGALVPLVSVKGQTSLLLPASVDLERLGALVGRPLRLTTLAALSPAERLALIARVWEHARAVAAAQNQNQNQRGPRAA